MKPSSIHDVAIVGGGAAGLSAAVTLARSLRSVIVLDAGEPRNAPSAGAHNVLGREGIPPRELLSSGRREAESYGAEFRSEDVSAVRRIQDGFELDLAAGETVRTRRLLLATGLVDELPEVPGVRQLWGTSVLHCPYCHGWEIRGRRIGVLGTSPFSTHQAFLFRQLSDDVTLFLHGMPEPDKETRRRLAARGIAVVEGPVRELRTDNGTLQAVVVEPGTDVPVDAVTVVPRFIARADLYLQLGGVLTEHPMGTFIETDPTGRTALPGVWAAGNVTNLGASVAVAAGAGVSTAGALNGDLVEEDTDRAVDAVAGR